MKVNSCIVIALLFISTSVLAKNICGELTPPHPPYKDLSDKAAVRMVEVHHFTPEVEKLIRGSTGTLGNDIDYTLHHFPNHPRALMAMSRLSLRDKTPKPHGATYSALCYFDRAIRFKPNDALVRSIYSSHLLEIGKPKLALEQLKIAAKIEPENPTTSYNLGLLYFKQKKYDEAMHYAKKAYSLDFPLPGLKNKLIKIGKWKE